MPSSVGCASIADPRFPGRRRPRHARLKALAIRRSPARQPFSGIGTFLLFAVGLPFSIAAAAEDATLSLRPAHGMDRAELRYVPPASPPRAVLVLCPGVNGDGGSLIQQKAWRTFAQSHRLGLVGLSFASPQHLLSGGTGYYHASQGSGDLLLEGIRTIYRCDPPLLLYGISGGAHFTSRFTEWKPRRVASWCAYAAGWWDVPRASTDSPPGIVACGEDDPRYGATLIYFKQGRAAKKPWLWVSVPKTGHTASPALEDFVREYFSQILSAAGSPAVIVDIDRETLVPAAEDLPASLTAVLPSCDLLDSWKKIHEP
ncbi:MAG TPA: hypothetical protein PLS03_04955 [Terrimicrobiaceae bacterium]|nr:hypothetical protein [Terrimicrobiaceae bacterium]